jgi:hypothetical protein
VDNNVRNPMAAAAKPRQCLRWFVLLYFSSLIFRFDSSTCARISVL